MTDALPTTIDMAALTPGTRLSRRSHLYGCPRRADASPGLRHYLCTLPAGALLMPLAAENVIFLLVYAVAAEASTEAAPVDDHGAFALSLRALLSSPFHAQAPSDAFIVDGDHVPDLGTGGLILTSRRLIWLERATGGLFYCGHGSGSESSGSESSGSESGGGNTAREVPNAGAVRLPLTDLRGGWADAGEPFTVYTHDQAAERHGTIELAGACFAHFCRASVGWLQHQALMRQQRRQITLDKTGERFRRSLQDIADIAQGTPIAAATKDAWENDPLLKALDVLAGKLDLTLTVPPVNDYDTDFLTRLEHIGATSRFRFRRVELEPDWYKNPSVAMLVFEGDTEHPRAVIPSRGRYKISHPQKRRLENLDTSTAEKLSKTAYMFYTSLPDQPTARNILRFFLSDNVHRLVSISLIAFGTIIMGLMTPIIIGQIVAIAIPETRPPLLYELTLIMAAAAVGAAAFQIAEALIIVQMGGIIDLRLQSAIWDRVLRLPARFFKDYGVGDLAQRILGVDIAQRVLSSVLVTLIVSGLLCITNLGLMIWYEPAGAGFSVIYGVSLMTFLLITGVIQVHFQGKNLEARGRASSFTVEMLSGITKLRAAAAEERAFVIWSRRFSTQRIYEMKVRLTRVVLRTVMSGAPIIGAMMIFLFFRTAAESGPSTSVFIVFNTAFGQFIGSITSLSYAFNTALIAKPIINRLQPVIKAIPEIDASRINPGRLIGKISVSNVSFGYSEDMPLVLNNISFTLNPGEFVALVGPSGCGKSTLVRLLLGFEKAHQGTIFFDDFDLNKIDLRLVRRQIGSVLQNGRLIPGSIRENLVGAGTASTTEIDNAIDQAGLRSDLENMPMKLETIISEGSGTLSGGQRQRIMIARALVHQPPMLFFDEATSALDNQTQKIVAESLDRLSAGRLIIAHRLSTIRNADRILLLRNGQIAEQGSYDELMAEDTYFRAMARRQIA